MPNKTQWVEVVQAADAAREQIHHNTAIRGFMLASEAALLDRLNRVLRPFEVKGKVPDIIEMLDNMEEK